MAKLIFIFAVILAYFLTIVSKTVFAGHFSSFGNWQSSLTSEGKDTIYSIFNCDFESGNLSGWNQAADWEISGTGNISGNFSLKHLSTATNGSSFLFHEVSSDWNLNDVEWSFKLKNGNWDPSSSNKFWFYLSIDTIKTELANGWAVGVNISGSNDLLALWRIRNGKPDSLIVQSDLDWNASVNATINVKRSVRGSWAFTYQKQDGPVSQTFLGTDKALAKFRNIGVCFKYTSTRAGQLWVDDISISISPTELFIQGLSVANSHTIILTFNKPFNPASVDIENFKLTDENNVDIQVQQVTPMAESSQAIEIQFGKVVGVQLNLSVSGITDLSGKTMVADTRSFPFSFCPEKGSVLINEVLFNSLSGGTDFVELVNVSEVPISIHRLKLAARNDTLALKQIYPVSSVNRYLKPGEYLTCTKDSLAVASFYFSNNPESFCIMKSFPSYPDDAGNVVLLNDSLEVIDEFSYSAKMHSPFLADENGVSLERISLEKPTSDRTNWMSAAASAGFATPGLPNSQTEIKTATKNEIIPEPLVFSPNGDGYNDLLTIRFIFDKPGYIANVRIFDVVGRQVKFLAKNESLGQEGSWPWNGDSDSGQKLKLGVYIILVEVFDSEGNTKTFKKTCTLSDRMN